MKIKRKIELIPKDKRRGNIRFWSNYFWWRIFIKSI